MKGKVGIMAIKHGNLIVLVKCANFLCLGHFIKSDFYVDKRNWFEATRSLQLRDVAIGAAVENSIVHITRLSETHFYPLIL